MERGKQRRDRQRDTRGGLESREGRIEGKGREK